MGAFASYHSARSNVFIDGATPAHVVQQLGVEGPEVGFRFAWHPRSQCLDHTWVAVVSSVGGVNEPAETLALFPLSPLEECGQEYYLVSRTDEGAEKLLPRSPLGSLEEDVPGEAGYFAIEHEELWSGDDGELPENWFDELQRGPRIKESYAAHRPIKYGVGPDGTARGDGVRGWYQPRPFLICLRCRAVYDKRDGEYRKLASLSQTGRSTATTVLVNAAVSGLTEQGLPREEAKVLSFTDNRQDASLQAGHLNDFVQVAQLRAGIIKAVQQKGHLTFDIIGQAVFDALSLSPEDFLEEPVPVGDPGYNRGRETMIRLLEYRA